MQSSQVIEHINSFDVEGLRSGLSEAPTPENDTSLPSIIDDTIAWFEDLRRDLISTLEEVGEGEDIELTLAINYVEYKSRWIAFNTKMNYMMFRGAPAPLREQCRGTAVSELLGHIEPLLRDGDIERITSFLAQPVGSAA
ncbi:MAG: hypothetical protein AAF108_06535 [Planctomycetota bacterium]